MGFWSKAGLLIGGVICVCAIGLILEMFGITDAVTSVRSPPGPKIVHESGKATDSKFNGNPLALIPGTSLGLSKADLAWHASNTYGWPCDEVIATDGFHDEDFFYIVCRGGLRLRVYPRSDAHPRITNKLGTYQTLK